MIGFALGIIKFNADVIGRLFTVALNVHFKVMMEPIMLEHATNEPVLHATTNIGHLNSTQEIEPISMSMEIENLTPGLGIMYVIQAGLVVIPVFFIWLMAKRARVEEVQVAIHNHDTHENTHPDDTKLTLIEQVEIVRQTNNIRKSVYNDFKLLTQSVSLARADHLYAS